MSLFGRRNLNLDEFSKAPPKGKKKGKEREDPKTLSQRKQSKRVFQIAETPLGVDPPVFGKGGPGGGAAASSFLSSSPDSDSDSESLFPKLDFGTSSSSTSGSRRTKSSSNMDTLSASAPPNKIVEAALATSKLTAITSKGPIEASPKVGKRKLKAAKKHEKSLTKGALWFNMAKTEVTKEKKNDLDVLKLRGAMGGGSHHYKRNNITHTPKYFQVGTIVETKADFYSGRIPKKQRKNTLAHEFAAEYGAL